MKLKKLIVVVGPTAIGKTAFAIQLAQNFHTEIISADARQFFKETNIGTAKPSTLELQSVKHHFINSHSVQDFFSTGDFENEALQCINQLFLSYDHLIMVGGSGLYIDALCKGLDALPATSLKIREKLMLEFEELGIQHLQQRLLECDPISYQKMDIQNTQRVIRALEFYDSTGQPLSAFQTGTIKNRPFEIIKIGLNTDRSILYERINRRVDIMMKDGLLKEVESLMHVRHLNALKTVGYAELFEFIDDKISLEQAVEKIKQNTRRFAKRQITWFKKDESTHWFEPEELLKIIDFLKEKGVKTTY